MHLDEHHHVPIIDERLFGYETLLTVIIRRPSTQLMIGSLAICQMHYSDSNRILDQCDDGCKIRYFDVV